jgi:hypothetical protein
MDQERELFWLYREFKIEKRWERENPPCKKVRVREERGGRGVEGREG